MKDLKMLKIRSFRAIDENLKTNQYSREQSRVLKGIGVHHVFRKNELWKSDPANIIVAAYVDFRMIGGIRLQMDRDNDPLGMLNCLEVLDPKVLPMFDAWARKGLGELCGLWVNPDYTGHGIARQLLIAAVSLADQLPINTLVSFGAEYTARSIIRTGFETILSLGNHGVFDFPTPERQSYALVNQHIRTCKLAPENFKKQLLALRRSGNIEIVNSELSRIPSIKFELQREALYNPISFRTRKVGM